MVVACELETRKQCKQGWWFEAGGLTTKSHLLRYVPRTLFRRFSMAMTSMATLAMFCALCAAEYPSAPWTQHGTAYVQTFEVNIAHIRDSIPMEFGVVETKKGSGVTSGSLYVVQYQNTSTIEYSEFIFIPATVTYRGKQGSWISDIYVDNTAAQQAGRELWGLNKSLGTFAWDRDTDPNMQHVKLTDAASGALVFDGSFNDHVLVTIPGQKQTEASFGIGATTGVAAGLPSNTIVFSQTQQKYGVKLLKTAYYNVPASSPLHDVFSSATLKTKVAMANGLFNMTAPLVLGRPSRAKKLFSTTPEVTPHALPITNGTIPDWLQGALIRNSASGYENGHDEMRHWCDGWAQLHRWDINGNAPVKHQSKWLNSSSYHKAISEAEITQAGYATPANPGPRDHKPLANVAQATDEAHAGAQAGKLGGLTDKFAVNPMVNVWKFDNKYMATTDQNMFIEFDPQTLETLGGVNAAWQPDDVITKKGVIGIGAAHGRYDRFTKEHFWLEIDLAMDVTKAKYNVWTYKESNFTGSGPLPARKLLATLKDSDTSFMHSFGLTKNYIILIQCPMNYHFNKFVLAKSVVDTITWDDKKNVKFHILSRQTGELIRTVEDPAGAWFVYHIMNAWEDPTTGDIGLDFSRYHNDSLITQGMFLENLVDMPELYTPTYGQAMLTRCTVSPQGPVTPPSCTQVTGETFEMATFNWQQSHMKQMRFTYGASFRDANTPWNPTGTSDFIDSIIKVDIEQGAVVASWSLDGVYICEPIFAPRPGATDEDDGALLTVAYDAARDQSYLLIIDAKTMQEMARVNMVGHLAGNFHGKWCPKDADYCIGL